jgi:ferredoxin
MPVIHSLYREAGVVQVDEEACSRCGECVRVCPADALELDHGRVRARADSLLGCIACGHCMMVCPKACLTVTGRDLSPEDLRPLPAADARASADALEALMASRRSIRRFDGRQVEPALLDRIVRMATLAPMGVPPWDVGCVVVEGREEVEKLAREVVAGYEGFLKIFRPWVLALLRPWIGRARYEQFRDFIRPLAKTYVAHHRAGEDIVFWGAPAVLIFHHSPYADKADTMIPCAYAMLAAESLGLGGTMIGGAPPILQRNPALCRRLGIPEGNTPAICLILGYPAVRFLRTVRRRFPWLQTIGGEAETGAAGRRLRRRTPWSRKRQPSGSFDFPGGTAFSPLPLCWGCSPSASPPPSSGDSGGRPSSSSDSCLPWASRRRGPCPSASRSRRLESPRRTSSADGASCGRT